MLAYLYLRDFNSLAPCGANLIVLFVMSSFPLFQLTRPVWGEPRLYPTSPRWHWISTHSPRVGRTIFNRNKSYRFYIFQLTRPVWGEPYMYFPFRGIRAFQLTRPVWGEPYHGRDDYDAALDISTHSPRVGRTSTSCIFVDCSPLLGVDNNFFSRSDCGFLWCSSANRARFSHRLRFAIRT